MRDKAKVKYVTLQKKYPGQIVALSAKEDKILAVGKDVIEVEGKLKNKGVKPERAVFVGPIEEYGRVCVYPSL